MDLGAYMQIENLDAVAKENGIEVPRLRGYRLMKNEDPVPQEAINKMKSDGVIEVVERLCGAEPFWSASPMYYSYDEYTDRLKKHYLIESVDENGEKRFVGVRWDRVHGKKRKILKYAIKKMNRKIQNQYDAWNRYAGMEGVLYIHSRMGGWNWEHYDGKKEISEAPWFLERVDDWWDGTYCDFYAKIR